MSNLMQGKRGLIMGLANDRSLAWGIAQALHAHGAELSKIFPAFRSRSPYTFFSNSIEVRSISRPETSSVSLEPQIGHSAEKA